MGNPQHLQAALLPGLLAALLVGCPGCEDLDDDDASDDDSASGDDDTLGDDDIVPVDLPACLTDLGCAYVFSCGHRGATLFAPENTLAGIDVAIEMGMDSIEVDVQPTADEVLILMHDDTVDRTTDGTGSVSEMTLDEIRELRVVSEFDGIPDQEVPTFAEALEALAGRALVNVDAKTHRMDLIAADIITAGMQRWCFVQVDDIDEGLELRAADPTILVMPDAESTADVQTYYDALSPDLYEFPWQIDDPEPIEAALQVGSRATQDALGVTDAVAIVHESNGDDPCLVYQPMWELGITLIQTDAPNLLAPCLQSLNAANGYSGVAQIPSFFLP